MCQATPVERLGPAHQPLLGPFNGNAHQNLIREGSPQVTIRPA